MRRILKRTLAIAGAILGVAVVAGVVVIGPRNIVGMARYDIRREGDYKVGDVAPDVELLELDGTRVHLRDRLAGKPTVLVFGSFT